MATVTEPTPARPTPAPSPARGRDRIVLYDVPWDVYVRLRDVRQNDPVRMSYCDGELELTLPDFPHELWTEQLGLLVRLVALELGIEHVGAGSTTFRRAGPGDEGGAGKEPDRCFYFANEPRLRGKRRIDMETDPPPDLAIEIENTKASWSALPIYARLGVPEVWLYNVESDSLWFGALQADGTYAPLGRSNALPMLTPDLVLGQLRRSITLSELQWLRSVRDWVRDTLMPRPEP